MSPARARSWTRRPARLFWSFVISRLAQHAVKAGIGFLNAKPENKIFSYFAAVNEFRTVIAYLERKVPEDLPRSLPPLLALMSEPIFVACSWDSLLNIHVDPGRDQLPELIGQLERALELLHENADTITADEHLRLEAILRLTTAAAYMHVVETEDDPATVKTQLTFCRDQYEAVRSAVPQGDPPWLEATAGQAEAHLELYRRWRDVADLDAAESLLRGMADQTPEGLILPADAVLPFAAARMERFELSADHNELAGTVLLLRQALAESDKLGVPKVSVQLGKALTILGTERDSVDLLSQAIETLEPQTGFSQSHGRVEAAEWLAKAYGARGFLRRDSGDFLAAAQQWAGLFSGLESFLAGETAPAMRYLYESAWLMERQYRLTGDPDVLRDAQAGYQRVLDSEEVSRDYVLLAAARLGFILLRADEPEQASEVFERALELQRLLVGRQLRRSHMLDMIGQEEPVTMGAAVAYALSGHPDRAVMVLEQGRARVLGQALDRDRAELDRLAAAGHGELRDRYRTADDALTRLLAADAAPDEVAEAHAAFLEVAGEIRAVPGWSGFRSPADLTDILAAAQEHPLIYLLAAVDTGLALVVADGAARSCWLPGLTWTDVMAERSALDSAFQAWASATPTAAKAARHRYQQAFGRLCRWLGSAAMTPLLDDLPAADWITLVACGPLGGVPLHAAVLPAKEEEEEKAADSYALDRILITYAPSAVSLTRAAGIRDRLTTDRVLVISDPRGPADKHLPAAALEAAVIARHFPPDGRTVLADAAATAEQVTAALGEVSVLHAACHAVSDPGRPLESALLLAEGTRLTVRQLTDRPLAGDRRLRLAVLSACESAAIGTAAPDELVGLPSALLEVGAAGVIASLILVPDRPTALLMVRFYEHWRTGGMPAPEALRHAQQWLRDATNEELLRLYPDLVAVAVPAGGLRYRIWAQARPHRDPTHWAAFTYLGA